MSHLEKKDTVLLFGNSFSSRKVFKIRDIFAIYEYLFILLTLLSLKTRNLPF